MKKYTVEELTEKIKRIGIEKVIEEFYMEIEQGRELLGIHLNNGWKLLQAYDSTIEHVEKNISYLNEDQIKIFNEFKTLCSYLSDTFKTGAEVYKRYTPQLIKLAIKGDDSSSKELNDIALLNKEFSEKSQNLIEKSKIAFENVEDIIKTIGFTL